MPKRGTKGKNGRIAAADEASRERTAPEKDAECVFARPVIRRLGRIVNKKELAQIFGVSVQAVDGWISRGCPYVEKGRALEGYKFDSSVVAEWRTQLAISDALIGKGEGDGDEDLAARRKLEAEASLAELKLARETGQLIAMSDVESTWMKLIGNARAKLLSIPAKTAPLAHTAETIEEAQSAIELAIHEALNELAEGNGTSDSPEQSDSAFGAREPEPEGDGGGQAAPETNRIPVGRPKEKTKSGSKRRTRPVEHK